MDKILDLIYPPICSICGKLNKNWLCSKCKLKLEKEFMFQYKNYLGDTEKNFLEQYSFFKYENIIRGQILSLKFKEKPYIYKTISSFLKNKQKYFENIKKYDIIITVPISKKRRNKRGYNQTELILSEICKFLRKKINKKIIYKIKDNIPQSMLNKKQREENVKNVYKAKINKKFLDKKILIIDDIYTTGNTVNECARVLLENGLKKENIGILTLAID